MPYLIKQFQGKEVNKLSLQLEGLSNCDNFTVITILCNNDVLTWDYKNNNKYQVTKCHN